MWWIVLASAAPEAAYGLSAPDGTVAWDAEGTAHGCIGGSASRTGGVVGGGLALTGGRLELPLVGGPTMTVALYARGLDDGVLVSFGELELAAEGGEWWLAGVPMGTGPTPNNWSHVAIGVHEGIASLWVAQAWVGSVAVDGASGPLMLGGRPDGTGTWRGDVDEVAVIRAAPEDADLLVLTTGFGGPTDVATCADYDGDGLDDLVEIDIGTDPNARDSDRDSFDDATEVEDVSRPVDFDGDGVIDALDDDDDNDGIPSIKERTSDADGDGSPDLDPDGDGLENGRDLDSDGDGRLDADEGLEDSDGDGILDFLDATDDSVGTGGTEPSTGPAADTGPDEGCGCQQGSGGAFAGLTGVLLVLLRRRQR